MLQREPVSKLDLFFSNYKPLQYKSRTVISSSSDLQASVYYIKNGFLRVFRISEQGEELTVTILKPKDLFPLTFGMTEAKKFNTYYLEAITTLEITKVHIEQFHEFITTNADVYEELTQRLLVRFDDALSKMEYLVFNNAYTKIVATVISCAKKFGERHGNDIIINVPLTHKDITTLVGITRETTSLEMKKLEKQGFLSRNGKFLVVKQMEKLEEAAMLQTGSTPSYSYAL